MVLKSACHPVCEKEFLPAFMVGAPVQWWLRSESTPEHRFKLPFGQGLACDLVTHILKLSLVDELWIALCLCFSLSKHFAFGVGERCDAEYFLGRVFGW